MRWFRFIYHLCGAEAACSGLRTAVSVVLSAVPVLLKLVVSSAIGWLVTALFLTHAHKTSFVDSCRMIVSQRPVIDSIWASLLGFALLVLAILAIFVCVCCLAFCCLVIVFAVVGLIMLGAYLYTNAWRDTKRATARLCTWVTAAWEKSR